MWIRIACLWCVAWCVTLVTWTGAAFGQQQCIDTSDKCTAFSCQDGTCTGTPIVMCNNPDACTVSSCNPQTGACENTARNCDDGNPCTDDSCVVPAGCVHTPRTGSCDTGNPCTTGACLAGFCIPTPVPNGTTCSTATACFSFACQSGACIPTQTISCPDDGDKCTFEFCNPATGTPVCDKITITTCNGDQCHSSQVCNPQVGCAVTPTPLPGNQCDDGNPCTQNDTCSSDGVCNGQPITSVTGTPTSPASQTPTATVTPTAPLTATVTNTVPATASATSTSTATATVTQTPVSTATSTPTVTLTATNTVGPSATATATGTTTATQVPTASATGTGTSAPTATASATATSTRTTTATAPATTTSTATRTSTLTATATATATPSATATTTVTGTPTRTATTTAMPTSTPTPSPKLDVQPPVPHNFGNVRAGDKGKFAYTVQNVGGATLIGTAATPCDGFSVTPTAFNLAAGAQQTLMVMFSPPGIGSFSCQLVITSTGGDQQIALSAEGLPPAQIPAVASPTSPAGLAMIGLLAVGIVELLRRRAAR